VNDGAGGVKIGLYDSVKAAMCTALPSGTSPLILSALAGTLPFAG
jgi:hypothetical protein